MDLNQHIATAQGFAGGQQKLSMEQDNANKTNFALRLMSNLPKEPTQAEPPKIPSLGALAIPN